MSRPNEHEEAPNVNSEEIFVMPPSFGQERLWFLNQLEPDSPSYNVFLAVHFSGWLDQEALQKSLNEIVRRHEILRTTFSVVEGQLVQIIASRYLCQLQLENLRDLPQDQREAVVKRAIAREACRPFDLAHGPLFRAILLWLATDEYILLLTLHHVVFDEWSSTILKRELAALYNAYRLGQPSTLPELALQYADFAVWQRQAIQDPEIAQQLMYWQQQLRAPLPRLELLTDRPRTSFRSSQGATRHFALSPALLQRLRTLGQREGATLFMTLLAAFSTLLYRYSQQEDMLIGTPITNRNQAELEPLIGFFLNTLPLRIDISGNPSFQELLRRVRTLALQAYANQDIPFDRVIDTLHQEKSLGQHQLLQAMFILEDAADEPFDLLDLTSHSIEVEARTAKFDLILSCTEDTEHGLRGAFVYTTDLFDEASILALAEHFTILLEQICQTPALPVGQLPLLSTAEFQQILITRNKTQASYPRDKRVHELFEDQVALTPTACAVSTPEEQISYEELNRRANRLARYLQGQGTARESVVGLCMDRSLAFIIAVLGVLKAGAAYLPLDPSDPPERLLTVLTDAQASLILTLDRFKSSIPPSNQVPSICLDAASERIAHENWEHLALATHPSQLAYVLYTSGSTGEPKGVMIEHASLVNYLCWVNASLLGSEPLNLPFTTRPIFDASLKQFLAPLLRGDSVFVLPPEILNQPRELWLALSRLEYAGLNCVPAFWEAMLDATEGEPELQTAARRLSRLIVGGEAISRESIKRTLALSPHLTITNVYGPSEATANASHSQIISAEDISLGQPLANVQLYVLDAFLQPVPLGAPGELAIGGAGLARGYLHRPGLTAASFVPDPFSSLPGQRLYLTGDRVRYTSDGTLEFLGRSDYQVKMRGYRIELEEIERCLARHPAVRRCLVILHEDAYGVQRLVAYSVIDSATEVAPRDLKSFVQERLPHYMVPALFVALEDLPLTPQGKVARSALPQPDTRQFERKTDFSSVPRTPLEKHLAALWSDLLHLDQVSTEDNFFESGGDSLLSIFFVMRAQQAGLPLQAQHIVQYPTIAELARLLEQQLTRDYRPLTQNQQWFLETYLAAHPEYWHLTMTLEVSQPITPMQLEQAVQRIINEHEPLKLRCTCTSTGWQQYSAQVDGQDTTTWFDLAHLSQEEQIHVIETTSSRIQNSLNACEGALASVVYFDPGSQRPGLLFWNIHLLILDLLSDGMLLPKLVRQQNSTSANRSERMDVHRQFREQLALFYQEPAQKRSWPLFASNGKDLPGPLKELVWQYMTTLQETLSLADD